MCKPKLILKNILSFTPLIIDDTNKIVLIIVKRRLIIN